MSIGNIKCKCFLVIISAMTDFIYFFFSYSLWVTRCRAKARTTIFELEQEYQNMVDRLADVKRHEDLFLLRKAKVVYRFITSHLPNNQY